MRTRNWKKYNKQLIQRGSLTFLIDPKLFQAQKNQPSTKGGRPQQFSDQLIMMLMMVKIHYRLSYRMLQGFIDSMLALNKSKLKAPCYSLVCKRAPKITAILPKMSQCRSAIVILDSSGIKLCGEGEWKVKIHGRRKHRKWVKLHIAVDPTTQEIVAERTTERWIKDGILTGPLLEGISEPVYTVIGDGGYDERQSREAIRRKKAKPLIPPPKNARVHGLDKERDEAVKIIQGLGGKVEGRSLWGKLTGYNIRALVETAFSRMKRLFGQSLFSKTFDRQIVENTLRCALLNKMRKATA